MEVIKAVKVGKDGRLVSTFASQEWQKEYKPGVATIPNTGYLFAYSRFHLGGAKVDMGGDFGDIQYWLAEADVVGRLLHEDIGVTSYHWQDFWYHFSPTMKRNYTYLLCSSITLISRMDKGG